jgi:sulfite reductase (NADPH) flavoprotein alpha-component
VPPVVRNYAALTKDGLHATLLAPDGEDALWSYIEGRGLLDLVRDYPPPRPISAAEWVGLLRRMPPRLYSIASSLKAHPGEVHLTVAIARFQGRAAERYGVFSAQCHAAARAGDRLPVFVQENPKFRLPENPDTPLIMIGPGSGVAPFRAFLEEREEAGAAGPTWLFFGERRFRTDFLYQAEWQQRLAEGSLTQLDVAFSRDQTDKVYVQHRLRERAREVYDWLQRGAHVYVCGDEKRMAPDVHAALVDMVREQGGKSAADAEDYWMELQTENRYQRDVY